MRESIFIPLGCQICDNFFLWQPQDTNTGSAESAEETEYFSQAEHLCGTENSRSIVGIGGQAKDGQARVFTPGTVLYRKVHSIRTSCFKVLVQLYLGQDTLSSWTLISLLQAGGVLSVCHIFYRNIWGRVEGHELVEGVYMRENYSSGTI